MTRGGGAGTEPRRRADQASCQDRSACCGAGFFVESLRSLSLDRRKTMIESRIIHGSRSCASASWRRSVARHSTVSRRRRTKETLWLMRLIDEQFLEKPWYGSRQMARHLRRNGVNGTLKSDPGLVDIGTVNLTHPRLRHVPLARWPLDGQRLHRAAVALAEIRMRLPQCLRDRQ